jgi:hypothetical protein
MNSTLENPILEYEPKTESDVVVKEEKIIKKSKSTNGMYGVVIFFMCIHGFNCLLRKFTIIFDGFVAMFFKFKAGIDSNILPWLL